MSAIDTIKKDSVEISRITITGDDTKAGYGLNTKGTKPATITLKSGTRKSKQDPQPLYFVDGLPRPEGVEDLNPAAIASIHVTKGDAAIAQYGKKGKNGIVEIKTKLAGSGQNTESFKPKVASAYGSNQNQNVSVNIDKQLIILNGKEITKSEMDELKVENIASVNFIKGKPAISEYGEKGEHGVIVITTKK